MILLTYKKNNYNFSPSILLQHIYKRCKKGLEIVNLSLCQLNKKLKLNKKGMIMPLAILLLLIASINVIAIGRFRLDRISINSNISLKNIAQKESENALVYGVHASATKPEDGGHKCQSDWYNDKEHEITAEDGGKTKTKMGYTIKRFITYKGTTDFHNAELTGIARIYNNNIMVSEGKTKMNINLLYDGTDTGAKDVCSADGIKMKKETWRESK